MFLGQNYLSGSCSELHCEQQKTVTQRKSSKFFTIHCYNKCSVLEAVKYNE